MFNTSEVVAIYRHLNPSIKKVLHFLNVLEFEKCKEEIESLNRELTVAKKEHLPVQDKVLNEFYVLGRFLGMLSAYSELWNKIVKGEFSSSWNSLQDALDLLRTVKKFSCDHAHQNIAFFEFQLQELEKLYPYNIFVSIGATVERFECGICGQDIDSFDCPHIKGELYSGEMAYGIARNLSELNHVAMVKHPQDKRCVVKYDDAGEQFKLVRFLSGLILSEKLKPIDFGELRFSKKIIKNPDFRKTGRNEPCHCGSGKKFKKCCISKEVINGDHVDIVAKPINIDEIILT